MGHSFHVPWRQEGRGVHPVFRYCDRAARLPGEEVRQAWGADRVLEMRAGGRVSGPQWGGRAECLTWGHPQPLCSGETKEGAQKFMHTEGSSRHGHSGESPGGQKAGGEGGRREGGLQVPGQWTCGVGAGGMQVGTHCLTLTYSNISMVGKVFRGRQNPPDSGSQRQHLGRLAGTAEPTISGLVSVRKGKGVSGTPPPPSSRLLPQVSFSSFSSKVLILYTLS